jgi:hypothetical protein
VTQREKCVSFVLFVWPRLFLTQNTFSLSYEDYHGEKPEIYVGLHIKCLSYLVDLKQTRRMATNFSKNLIRKFTKILSVGVTVFHVDGRTDMTNSVTALCNRFPKAPKRGLTLIVAFLIEVCGVLLKLDEEKRRPVLDDCTEIRIKLLRFTVRKLKL